MMYDVSSDIDFIGWLGMAQSDVYSHMIVESLAVLSSI